MLHDAEDVFGKSTVVPLPALGIRQRKLGDDWCMMRLRELHVRHQDHRFIMQQCLVDLRTFVVG
jgi:hypothetical protein